MLAVALNSSSILSGDTLNLRGGSYHGPFSSTLSGSASNYITVRPYATERAVLDDGDAGFLLTNLPNNSVNVLGVPISGSELWPQSAARLLQIGSETFYPLAKTGTNWNLMRGYAGSTISSHVIGDAVRVRAPIIDHSGSYVLFRDLEFTSLVTETNRNSGTDFHIGGGMNLDVGVGNKIINCIFSNVGHPAIGFWEQGSGGEINGCIIYGTGQYYSVSTPTRGSAIYAQNSSGMATVKNCIMFRNFTTGGKVFGETGPVNGFRFATNVSFDNDLVSLEISSGSTPTSNTWMDGNFLLGSPMLSYVSRSNTAQYFINNVVVDGLFNVSEHTDSTYTNNTVFMPPGQGVGGSAIHYSNTDYSSNALSVVWDWNTYHLGAGSSPYSWNFTSSDGRTFNALGGGNLKFTNDSNHSWQDFSRFDAHSVYAEGWPSDYLRVSVQPLDYDTNRWHICVISTSGQTNTPLELSTIGFTSGQQWQLRDAQNYFVVVSRGRFIGNTINLPLNLTSVSEIPGVTNFVNRHTNSDKPGLFNAFVLTRQIDSVNLQRLSVEHLNLSVIGQ